MWKFGLIEIPQGSKNVRVRYEAKVFEEGSKFGIEGGRISKLWASINGETILNYDRGWDVRPATEIAKKAMELILAKIEKED